MTEVKGLINDQCGGDPSLFRDRIVIFGCLNDLNSLPPMKDDAEPLPTAIWKVAADARDYLKQFRFGHILWIGPGSEQAWRYDERNPPIRWQPRADQFMKIVAEAGHPILTGAVPLSKGELMQGGKTSTS